MKLLIAAIAISLAGAAAAQLGRQCRLDHLDRPVCAPPHGVITKDSLDRFVCGRGACVVDGMGRVQCASTPGGGALIDKLGMPRCVGGCEEAKQDYCVAPR